MIIGPRAKVILVLLLLAVGIGGIFLFRTKEFKRIIPTSQLIKNHLATPSAESTPSAVTK